MATSGKHWITEPTGFLEPKIEAAGEGSAKPKTCIEVFRDTVSRHGDRPALALKKKPLGGTIPKEWQIWTWTDYWNDSRKFAKALHHLKVEKCGIVNVLGFNSPEWFIANMGSIMGGGICAGLYTTNTSDACMYISQHSKAAVVVLEDNKQLEKYAKMPKGSLPHLKAVVVWNETVLDAAIVAKMLVPVHLWKDFLAIGVNSTVSDQQIDARLDTIYPGHCSTLIYTSGTTGPPKAVMISHDNITWTAKVLKDNYIDLGHEDRVCSYLPLSHIAAQVIDLHVPMALGACTYFCQPDALKGSLTATMKDVRPTFFFGVPRVWEKIQEKMVQVGRDGGAVKKIIATWAKGLGTERSRRAQYGQDGTSPCGYSCANKLVFSNVKAALGLDQAKACFTAAAPISVDTLNYFASLDIPVYEIFGQSECTGPHTVSYPGCWKIGTCGQPLYGTESKSEIGTKELCYRGRHIFMGYMYMPDKTAETIDEDGWLHSGDVAEFDDDNNPKIPAPSGFMKITGRIKELIITAGGENVPPVLIEDQMKAAMVAVSNCMVIGDRRKYLAMLLTLKSEVDKETGAALDQLAADALFVAKQIGSTATTVSEAAKDPLWKKYFDEGMKKANGMTTSNAQIVQKWRLLLTDFTVHTAELTPTMKLKRSVVSEKFSADIEAMYAEGGDN